MRLSATSLALALAIVAGCSGPGGTDCLTDVDCGGDVCARDGECLPASQVRAVKVTWTIRGMPASAAACGPTPDFYIQFATSVYSDWFGYEPVPCDAGQFSVDKLPRRFDQVEIGVDGRFSDLGYIDPATGTATFDLYP